MNGNSNHKNKFRQMKIRCSHFHRAPQAKNLQKSYLVIDIFQLIFLTEIHTECSPKILKYEFMQGKCLLLSSISENFPPAAALGEKNVVAHHVLLVYNYIFIFRGLPFSFIN